MGTRAPPCRTPARLFLRQAAIDRIKATRRVWFSPATDRTKAACAYDRDAGPAASPPALRAGKWDCTSGSYLIKYTVKVKRLSRMRSSGMWRPVGLVSGGNTSQHCSSLTNLFILKMEAASSSELSVLTRPSLYHIPKEGTLHSHRRENLKPNNSDKTLVRAEHFPHSPFKKTRTEKVRFH
jgi:hypothetical protein